MLVRKNIDLLHLKWFITVLAGSLGMHEANKVLVIPKLPIANTFVLPKPHSI